jgi:hypothetical protein
MHVPAETIYRIRLCLFSSRALGNFHADDGVDSDEHATPLDSDVIAALESFLDDRYTLDRWCRLRMAKRK